LAILVSPGTASTISNGSLSQRSRTPSNFNVFGNSFHNLKTKTDGLCVPDA
jgi:hypothetical protein